jgi:hypothetical protein
VCSMRLNVHQQAVDNFYQVTDSSLYLLQPIANSSRMSAVVWEADMVIRAAACSWTSHLS